MLTLAAALLALQAPPPGGTIEGVVRGFERAAGRPLAHAIVEASTPGEHRSAVADAGGRYRFAALPAGLVRLRVSHPGHRSARVDVDVPPGGTVVLDVDLERQPIVLAPIEVLGEAVGRSRTPAFAAPPLPEIEVIALGLSPGLGEAGLGEAASTLPGNDPSDPSDVLFMRGSTTDLKLVLLDGAPVYTPFHLAGLISSFDAFVLGGAALHLGGAPARYDGGLSYILDLRTRIPRRDRLRGRGALDLISANAALEGPIGDDAGFAASTRTLHDLGAGALGGSHAPYGYRDALGRIDAALGDRHRLSATAFWNEESVRLAVEGESEAAGPAAREGPEDVRWGNGALALTYRGDVGDLTLDAALSASGYRAELPLRPAGGGAPGSGPEPGLLASAETRRLRLTVDASAPLGASRVRFGGTLDRIRTSYAASRFGELGLGPPDDREAEGVVAGAYVDGVQRLVPGLDLRVGVRADAFSTEGGARLAPRAAFLWSLGERALLTVAAGRYHQYMSASNEEPELAVPDRAPARVGEALLGVAAADHLVLALDQQLGRGVRLGVEGFWKAFSGLGEPGSDLRRSSGIDVRVLHQGVRATAWLGYNLTWFWSETNAAGSTDRFAGRQLLSTGVAGTLDGRTGGALRLAYSAGLPYTSIPFGQRPAEDAAAPQPEPPAPELPPAVGPSEPVFVGDLDDGFLRLDVEVFARFTPEIGGRVVEARPYLRLINALDRRDALFYYFEPWRDEELRPLAERAILPVFGMEWRF